MPSMQCQLTAPIYFINDSADEFSPYTRRQLAVTPDVYQDVIFWTDKDTSRTGNGLTQQCRAKFLLSQLLPIMSSMDQSEASPIDVKAIIHERFPRTEKGIRIASFKLHFVEEADASFFLLDYALDEC